MGDSGTGRVVIMGSDEGRTYAVRPPSSTPYPLANPNFCRTTSDSRWAFCIRVQDAWATKLLELDLRASFLELLLDLLGLVLGDAFLDGLAAGLDQILRLFQAERGDRADLLDDVDLLVTGLDQDDVEFGLLFLGGRGTGTTGGRSHHHGAASGGLDAVFVLEQILELGRLQQRQPDDLFGEFLDISHFSSSVRLWGSGMCRPSVTVQAQAASASAPPSAIVATAPAMFAAGAAMALARLLAGAPSMPAISAISSSRDGISETALPPPRSRTVEPIAPPTISSLRLSRA